MDNLDPATQQAVQQQLEQNVLQTAKQIENTVDEQLHKLENMGEDDLEHLRMKRLESMKQKAKKKKEWLSRGHGEYREITDERDFFKEIKGEDKMVCHFYRENWPCKVMDKHLNILCKEHLETKFIKMNAEKSPFLSERLGIWMLPTLAIIKGEKTTDYVVGFDELGGTDDFSTETLRQRLASAGAVDSESQDDADLANLGLVPLKEKSKGTSSSIRRGHGYQKDDDDEDSDFGD